MLKIGIDLSGSKDKQYITTFWNQTIIETVCLDPKEQEEFKLKLSNFKQLWESSMLNLFTSDPNRSTGRTTKQIKEAPPNSIYVWLNDHLQIPRRIAENLGRVDIKFYSYGEFQGKVNQLYRGTKGKQNVIFDHATLDRMYNDNYFINKDFKRFLERKEIEQRKNIKHENKSKL